MKKQNLIFTRVIFLSIILAAIFLVFGSSQFKEKASASPPVETMAQSEVDHLVVLWTSGDPEVATKMAFMYTYNAKKYEWWKEITLIIWGPSAKLLSENNELQDEISRMKEEGIVLKACKACADSYGVTHKLEELGVEVIYIGKEFTDYIKSDSKVLTI